MWFIILWNSDAAFFIPNDITFHSYHPDGIVEVVLYFKLFLMFFNIKYNKFCFFKSRKIKYEN